MAKKKQERSYLKLRDQLGSPDLGRLVAEMDAKLEDYYVSPERYVSRAINIDDAATFFVGPKGIGKSAILQMVRLLRKSDGERIINISPDDLAFSALANVEANTPILSEAEKNQWLFKSLWEYVLSLEILRREYKDESSLMALLRRIIQGPHEKDAKTLLRLSFNDDGTKSSLSERIIQLVREVELSGQFGEVQMSGRVGLGQDRNQGRQLPLLSLVHSVAKQLSAQVKHPYRILIDDLDLHWTNTPVQNSFIAALFLALRNFSRPPNLKCVVAMRDHIFSALPLVDRDKLHDWVVRVRWDGESVRKMIESRLVAKLNIQPNEIWGTTFPLDGFRSIWEHTTGRPREAIRLAGLCVDVARMNSHLSVEPSDVEQAIRDFAEERIRELASEYEYTYLRLDLVIKRLKGWPREFDISKLQELALMLSIERDEGVKSIQGYEWACQFGEQPRDFIRILLETGAIYYKANRRAEAERYDPDHPQDITADTWFALNRMLAPALNVIGA